MEGSVWRQMGSLHLGLGEDHGQVKDEEAEAVIIGGMVLDIHATPSVPPNPRTTTPGKVHYILGGVARNVAECMSKLGARPYMISALGLDMAGNLLLEHWKSAGLSIEGIQRHQDIETAVVSNIFDVKGELAAAVASVESIEKFLTPQWIQQSNCIIHSAPVVMVDANLTPPALEASCRMAAESGIPVWFEPVSVAKSKRIVSVVEHITFASPNEDELIAMANALSGPDFFHPIERDNQRTKCSTESLFQMLRPAIFVLLEKGIKIVVVTLGSDGVFLCSKGVPRFIRNRSKRNKPHVSSDSLYRVVNSSCPPDRFFKASTFEGRSNLFAIHFPALPASVVRLTGAGDCLVGAALACVCAGLDVIQSLAVGIAAAKAAVEAETNVPPEFNMAKITDDARSVYFATKMMFCQSML
ncbi:Carbohydrate/puine kinase, PfkB, conserved site protein [Actinidia chinensis var. chinensis]|uniref:Carbohydrate/puine kinase, PfkB, conserved site protein n=1 Tax=Actinidia chinensis var. chinensis TaxID=1590841 RepID=A0A2R6R1Q0_ACTCC|nr:Carbohydrate/puine kinase, PfkB, conserved site protein [Actinidia chinensis var. chinensis]